MMGVVLLAGNSAFGQFLVQPLKMQVEVAPGKRFVAEVKLENLSTDSTENIGLRLVEVTQDPNGIWDDLPPGDPNLGRVELRSCLSWLRLEKDAAEVGPFQIVPLKLFIEVPPGTRGYYFAAIIAQSAPRAEEVEGYQTMTVLEYLIPVIVHVQGRTMRHEVDLVDVGLRFMAQTADRPAATVVTMGVKNAGGTFSRLQAMARIWQKAGSRWLKVTDAQFPPDMGIIPGVTLSLKQDVGRPLASGTYKIEGYLFVDGQRGGQVTREVEFKGDPRIVGPSKIDIPIDLAPREIFIDSLPGATRAVPLQVINISDDAVTIDVELGLPEHMMNAVNDRGVRGERYGCQDWVTISPRRFTLRGHGRQNLTVIAKMPATATSLPSYYAVVKLHATYANDGQKGGWTSARLCVQNKKAEGATQIDNMMLTVSETSPSRYMVVARFINNGDTHVQPRCRGALTTVPGDTVQKRFILTSEAFEKSGILLPMDTRNFSGVLDLADVPPGQYRVTALLEHDRPGNSWGQRGLEVVEEGGQKKINIIGMAPDDKILISL